MNRDAFLQELEKNPIIAAVKDEAGIEKCLHAPVRVVFVLFGDICTVGGMVRRIRDAGKIALVHADLISGLSAREVAADFLREQTAAQGIITTKPGVARRARALGMLAALRVFALDSLALAAVERQAAAAQPDLLEALPGIAPKAIMRLRRLCPALPLIASGLIADKEDVLCALDAGALAVSTSHEDVWFM